MKAPKNGKKKLGTLEHEIDASWGAAMRAGEHELKEGGPYKRWPKKI